MGSYYKGVVLNQVRKCGIVKTYVHIHTTDTHAHGHHRTKQFQLSTVCMCNNVLYNNNFTFQ